MRKFLIFVLILSLLLLNCCCKKNSDSEFLDSNLKNNDYAITGEQTEETKPDETPKNITWDEITENGVNEDLLAESINTKDLEKIATNLQKLCEIIAERERASDDYVLSAGWLHDYPESEEYKNVIKMGNSAMKPLYFIIYKSVNQGLYEYLCAAALAELSSEDYDMWATSKEFLEKFNEKIIEKRK